MGVLTGGGDVRAAWGRGSRAIAAPVAGAGLLAVF